jgi:hypothetical protein
MKLINMMISYNESLDDALWIFKNIDKKEFKSVKKNWVSSNIFKRYLKTSLVIIKRFICFFDSKRDSNLKRFEGDTLLYVNSENTKETLYFLKDGRKADYFYQKNSVEYIELDEGYVHNFRIPIWITLLSIINFIFFCLKYWNKGLKYPVLYFENWGKNYCNEKILKKNKIKNVVFANDHNIQNRLFLDACKKMNVKTHYLQHASITDKFPPLSFDFNYLFGKNDLQKYESIGNISGIVKLVGSPKLDYLYSIRKGEIKTIQTIGIAFNILDEIEKIDKLVNYLIANTSFKIIIRPHPRDSRRSNLVNTKIEWSIPNESSLGQFLEKIDFLITGDSSIHLEASYTNIKSIFFNFKEGIFDSYGFISSGVFKEAGYDDLIPLQKVTINKDYYLKIKPFINSVDEDYDGKVGEYIKKMINETS